VFILDGCYVALGAGDIVLLQYSTAGSMLWTRETGTSGDDFGSGVAASADGQYVYVSGYVSGSLNGQPSAGGNLYVYSCV
jgi:hypothetical protein